MTTKSWKKKLGVIRDLDLNTMSKYFTHYQALRELASEIKLNKHFLLLILWLSL